MSVLRAGAVGYSAVTGSAGANPREGVAVIGCAASRAAFALNTLRNGL